MKVFISQPMNGKTQEQILTEREAIIKHINELYDDVEIIDSYIADYPPEGVSKESEGLWYLSKSIKMLSQADLAYFAKGWEEARGCRIENTCAVEYGLEVIEDYRE